MKLSLVLIVFFFHWVSTRRDAFNYEPSVAFPDNIFNRSCLSASCTELNSSLCLGTSVNRLRTLQILSRCMRRSICGLKMEPRSIPSSSFTVVEVLPVNILMFADCNTTGNGFYENVIPTIVAGDDVQFTLALPNLALLGHLVCGLSFSVPTVGVSELPIRSTVTFPFVHNLTYSALCSIDSQTFKVSVSRPNLKVLALAFGDFTLPSVLDFFDVLPFFNRLVKSALRDSSLSTSLTNFYQSLFSSTFQLVATKCKHTTSF